MMMVLRDLAIVVGRLRAEQRSDHNGWNLLSLQDGVQAQEARATRQEEMVTKDQHKEEKFCGIGSGGCGGLDTTDLVPLT